MRYFTILFLLFLAVSATSCRDDEQKHEAEIRKMEMHNDTILKVVSSHWHFDVPPPTPQVEEKVNEWNEWESFRNELFQKPTGTIGAYKQKTKNLVKKADELRNNIPPYFDEPQVRSRIGVLITNIKSLYTYMNLDEVQDQKVTELINEITNSEISLQNQLDEIIRFREIKKEPGEEEMLHALDTVRMANPDKVPTETKQPQQTKHPQPARPLPDRSLIPKKKFQQPAH